jgi:hypothetical protein
LHQRFLARNVSIHLKSNTLSDYARTFEKDILPLLREQNGFKDEITFARPGGLDVTAISLWENKADAEAYNTNTYPQVLKTLARFIDGTPGVYARAGRSACLPVGISSPVIFITSAKRRLRVGRAALIRPCWPTREHWTPRTRLAASTKEWSTQNI